MSKIYQPSILEKVDEIIEILTQISFFTDYQIENLDFTKTYLSDKLTEKFIQGDLDCVDDLFNEDEFDTWLKEIVAGTILYELKRKGFINSYEDDGTEEIFFLTENGKKYLKELSED